MNVDIAKTKELFLRLISEFLFPINYTPIK